MRDRLLLHRMQHVARCIQQSSCVARLHPVPLQSLLYTPISMREIQEHFMVVVDLFAAAFSKRLSAMYGSGEIGTAQHRMVDCISKTQSVVVLHRPVPSPAAPRSAAHATRGRIYKPVLPCAMRRQVAACSHAGHCATIVAIGTPHSAAMSSATCMKFRRRC